MRNRLSEKIRNFHRSALVWDNHSCMPLRPDDRFLPQLERHRKAGVDVVSLNVTFDLVPFEDGFRVISFFRSWINRHPDKYRIPQTAGDILRNKKQGLLSVVFDIEGAAALGGQLDLIETYYDLGVRWMLIAYNKNNLAGGGCLDDDKGLTPFGRKMIRKMEQVGMVLCCSHTGHRTAREAMEYAGKPVIFSHSNPSAIREHARNIPDELIRQCASTGGVVGISGIGIFLGRNDISTETLVRHIRHVADLVGCEHVGLGLDYVFDGEELKEFFRRRPDLFPKSAYGPAALTVVEPERFPLITDALLKSGFNDREARAILGGNWLRVCREVWKKRRTAAG